MNAVTPIAKGSLRSVDWSVIEIAREDGPWSFKPDGIHARAARFIGMGVTRGLKNGRLEALRRFSVRAWYWDLIRASDVRAFLDAGYSRADVLEILSRVGMARGFIPTIEDEPAHPAPDKRPSGCRCG